MMRAHTFAPVSSISPATLIAAGNTIVSLSVATLLATIMVAYTHHYLFSIQVQILAHIGMMLSAGTLKLGYVVRLTGVRKRTLDMEGRHRGATWRGA